MWMLLLLATVVSVNCLQPKIVGGENTVITKYPYQVFIQYNGKHHCGGSIISRNWILTAAHCVYGNKPALFKIRIGSTYSNKGGILIDGITTISHELYDEDTFEYDVALIKLPSPIQFNSKSKAINLAVASTEVKTGSNAYVAGWGKTSTGGLHSNILKVLKIPIVDQKECQKIYQYYNPVTPEMLCAGYLSGGQDTCQGDSGGPLVYNGVQIGIVSWGAECAKAGFPGVYTRVSAIRSWITKRAGV